jgi:hypothetical protein
MPSFFFPIVGPFPKLSEVTAEAAGFRIHKRQWQTTTFDLATLASKHKLHVNWHIMDAFLSTSNCEIEVIYASDFSAAQERVDLLQSMLYLHFVAPFVIPYGASHSINQYSGINSRDSTSLAKNLPEGLQIGITSADTTVEAWVHKPTFVIQHFAGEPIIDEGVFRSAAADASRWSELENGFKPLRTVRRAFHTAPIIPDLSSSLLHLWQGIEALFPQVTMEVNFRLALLVAQLAGGLETSSDTYKHVKQCYSVRSKAAHGNIDNLTNDDWKKSWQLLRLCMCSVLSRDRLPTEDDLMAELLGNAHGRDP